MPPREVPILIVGAGPSGVMAALLLRRLGIRAEIVERRPTWQRAPAAHVVNPRTFEICRAAGVDMDALARASQDPADAGHVYFATRFGGEVLGRHVFEDQGDDQLAVTPTPLRNLSQNHFEPCLLDALEKSGASGPRWRQQWESAEQDGKGVVSRVRDLETDRVEEIRSDYLLAADGAGSRIRKALGIGVTGPDRIQSFVMIHIRANLRPYVEDPPGVLYFLFDPRHGGAAFVIHDLDHAAVYMHPYDSEAESLDDYDVARCEALVRGAMEVKDVPLEVENISTWHMTCQVADRYREGRVFLVGDAAHRFPPTGGLGLNTGVQDVHNLTWKLAAVIQGRAPASLLDSYEVERRPVAQMNAERSLSNAMKLVEVPRSLGIADRSEESYQRMQEVLADPEGRARVSEAVANQAAHFSMAGLHLGFCYQAGALVGEPGVAPDPLDSRTFVPSGRPGSRLPHAWLRGAPGESLLDRVALDRFLLIAGPAGDAWLAGARALERADLGALQVGPELLEDWEGWLAAAGIGPGGALLVRPDQHVAWRAAEGPADAEAELARVMAQVLSGAV